jgi:hypothetical protein
VDRIFKVGNVTPKAWMMQAVGTELSIDPMLDAVAKSLEVVGGG